jgi:predicted secreted Zn-dependent protease
MRRLGFALLALLFARLSLGCAEAPNDTDAGAGNSGTAGGGARAGASSQAGASGAAGSAGFFGAGGASGAGGGQGPGGASGAAGFGGAAGGSAGTGGASGTSTQAGTAGAGGGAGAAAGGTAGVAGASGTGQGGAAGRAGAGADAGTAGNAGAGGEPNDDPSACESPFETLDISELVATETLERYTVTGTTANAIRQSLDANRQGDYDAYTSWYLSWQFGDCSGGGLSVTVDVMYRMPEWQEPSNPEPGLVESWQAYMSALFCHEYGHAKFGLDAANEIHAALSEIDAGGDCTEQQSLAQQAFDAILDDYLAREIEYDTETGHGATMGAIFPPP